MEERKDTKSLLEDAIKKRDELNIFIKVLQEMLGDATPASSAASPNRQPELTPSGDVADPLSVIYPGIFFGKSQPQAAKLLLERVRRPLKTKVIVECLAQGGLTVGGKYPAINMWGILNRSKDMFVLVPKAGWGLTPWYDESVIARMRKESAKEILTDDSNGKDDG
jgi:hypothetical protein